jgi:hypothetical protein
MHNACLSFFFLRRIASTSDALHRFHRYGVAFGGVTWTDYAPARVFLNGAQELLRAGLDALDVDA